MFSLVQSSSEGHKIIDGTLDRLERGMLEFNREGKLRTKPKRKYTRRKDRTMATATVNAVQNETKSERELPEPIETEYGFKLKGDGTHVAQKRVFNFETLERETKEKEYEVKNITDIQLALKEIEGKRLLALINLGLQKEALMQAKQAIGGSNAKAVNNFINNFRNLPQFAKVKDRKQQTRDVMEFIKSIEPMYDQLKQLAAESQEDDDDSND